MSARAPHPIWRIVSGLFVAASPFVLYYAITRDQLETGAWIIVGWLLVRTIPAVLAAPREHVLAALRLPAVAIVFAVLGAVTHHRVLLLLMPSLTQAGFAWVFLGSLRSGQMPLIERFARMQKPELGPYEQAHCRFFTAIWGFGMVLSAAVGVVLALFAPVWVWAAFAGIGSYAFVAVLFAVEYVVRAVRFRRFGDNAMQRMLLRVMP